MIERIYKVNYDNDGKMYKSVLQCFQQGVKYALVVAALVNLGNISQIYECYVLLCFRVGLKSAKARLNTAIYKKGTLLLGCLNIAAMVQAVWLVFNGHQRALLLALTFIQYDEVMDNLHSFCLSVSVYLASLSDNTQQNHSIDYGLKIASFLGLVLLSANVLFEQLKKLLIQ